MPFTIDCSECDAGTDIKTIDRAVTEGWAEIDYAPGLPMANYIGLCPECRERYGHWPTADDRNEE